MKIAVIIAFLCLMLFITGCSCSPLDICEPPSIPAENGCCLDQNWNGVCDRNEPAKTPNITASLQDNKKSKPQKRCEETNGVWAETALECFTFKTRGERLKKQGLREEIQCGPYYCECGAGDIWASMEEGCLSQQDEPYFALNYCLYACRIKNQARYDNPEFTLELNRLGYFKCEDFIGLGAYQTQCIEGAESYQAEIARNEQNAAEACISEARSSNPQPAASPEDEGKYLEGKIILEFKQGVSEEQAIKIISSYGLSGEVENVYYALNVPKGKEIEWACKLKNDPQVWVTELKWVPIIFRTTGRGPAEGN